MQRILARARRAFDTPWRQRWHALGRDLGTLIGTRPAPALIRAHAPGARATRIAGTRWLTVREVVHETADAATLFFERDVLADWRPGQFLTVHLTIDGERLRRAYSLCTRADDPRGPAITIKRVPGGKVSNALVAAAEPGLRLEVRGPSGQFTLPPRTGLRRVLLVGGGSGITPLVTLAEALCADGDRVTLLFGNRDHDAIIFRDRLAALAAAHPEQLVVRHVLETPPDGWSGGVGRLDPDTLVAELERLAAREHDLAYSCGPVGLMESARAALTTLGIARERLREERFQSLGENRARALPTTAQALRITLDGATHEVVARPGATILEAGLAAGLAMPFSCTMGGCGACRVHLEGEVAHDTPNGLGPEEEAQGYAFACIARPLGPCAIEVRR